ncbi:MAG TPA: flagellar hook-length control protein FliK [Sphingomonas sp.]|nr:flagellar hook-length control protein FliK [Sphingomonas sp.]
MISLSPALPPAAPRVSGGMAAAVPPGDFAAALAGLLVPDIDSSDLPVAPADRQIAAATGKGLPEIAARDVPGEDADAATAIPLPVPTPDRPAPPVLPLLSRGTPDPAAASPPLVEDDPEASPEQADLAGDRVSRDKRAPTRKNVIAALPLPIPAVAIVSTPTPATDAAIAPAIEEDGVASETAPVAPPPVRGRNAEIVSHEQSPANTHDTATAEGTLPISNRAPTAGRAFEPSAPSSERSSSDSDRTVSAAPVDGPVPDTTLLQAPMVLEHAATPVIVEVIGTQAAPAAARPLRFVPALPASPVGEAASSPKTARMADTATASVARAATVPQLKVPVPVATAPQSTDAEPIAMPRGVSPVAILTPPAGAMPVALSQVVPTTSRPQQTPSHSSVVSAPATLVAPARDSIGSVSATDGASLVPPVSAARSATSGPVAPEAGRVTLPAHAEPVAVTRAPAPAQPVQVEAAAMIQPLAPRDRPSPARPASISRPLGLEAHAADAVDPMIAAMHPTTATAPAEHALAAQRTPLDMRRDDWTQQLIDRIERVRDIADAADTRIKLAPDALGKIDVSMRKDGDSLHVTFTADVAQTRAMLAEAQPRLAELAAQRGLRLGQASVDAGAGGQNQHQQHAAASPAPLPSRPASAAARDEGSTETGRLA